MMATWAGNDPADLTSFSLSGFNTFLFSRTLAQEWLFGHCRPALLLPVKKWGDLHPPHWNFKLNPWNTTDRQTLIRCLLISRGVLGLCCQRALQLLNLLLERVALFGNRVHLALQTGGCRLAVTHNPLDTVDLLL